MHRFLISTLTAAATLAIFVAPLQAQATAPFVRTIVVSPVPGNPVASGDQLRNAVASINPSSGSRWTIQLEPGVFDVGRNYLQLKPWLSIQGAGTELSVIRGNGQELVDRSRGVVQGATKSELRHLQIDCVSAGNDTGCIAMANLNASPRLTDVKILAKGGSTTHWGMRNSGSSPRLDDVEILTSGGATNYGMVNSGGVGNVQSEPTIRRSSIQALNGSGDNIALLNREGSTAALIEDTEIEAWGGSLSAGIQAIALSPQGQTMTLRRISLRVWGAATTQGVFDGLYQQLLVEDSDITVEGANGLGIAPNTLGFPVPTAVQIRGSRVTASQVLISGPDVVVVDSWLGGGGIVTGGTLQCASIVNDALQFLPTSCS